MGSPSLAVLGVGLVNQRHRMKGVAAIFVGLLATALSCPYSPEMWCDSEEIALECEVYDICESIGWPNRVAPQVNVALYYESLCPGCRSFITGQVAKAVQEIGDIITVDLVPFGNAHEEKAGAEGDSWKFTCQHGESECRGNMMETCAMSLLKDFKSYWPFVLCLESTNGDFDTIGQQCASKAKVDFDSIKACVNGAQGNAAEHKMAEKTENLNPPHKYTPWIVVNGKHNEIIQRRAQMNLVKYVCEEYTGTKPAACSKYIEKEPLRCERN